MSGSRQAVLVLGLAIFGAGVSGNSWGQASGSDIWPSFITPVDIYARHSNHAIHPQLGMAYRDSGTGTAEAFVAYWQRVSSSQTEELFDVVVRNVTSNAEAIPGPNPTPMVTFGPEVVIEQVQTSNTSSSSGPVDIAIDSNGEAHVAYAYSNVANDTILRIASESGGWISTDVPVPTPPGFGDAGDVALDKHLDLDFAGTLGSIVLGLTDAKDDEEDTLGSERCWVGRFESNGQGGWTPVQIDSWGAGEQVLQIGVLSVSQVITASGEPLVAYTKLLPSVSEIWIWDPINLKSLLFTGGFFSTLDLAYDDAAGVAKLAYNAYNSSTGVMKVWFTEQNPSTGQFGTPELVTSFTLPLGGPTWAEVGLGHLLVDSQGGSDKVIVKRPVDINGDIHEDAFLYVRPTAPAAEWTEEELRPLSGSSGQFSPHGILEEPRVMSAAIHANSGRPVIVDVVGNGLDSNILRFSRGPSFMLHAIESPENGCICAAKYTLNGNVYRPVDTVGTFYAFDSLPPATGTWEFDCTSPDYVSGATTGNATMVRSNLTVHHQQIECGQEPKTDCGLLLNEAGLGFGWRTALLPLIPALAAIAGWAVWRKRWS